MIHRRLSVPLEMNSEAVKKPMHRDDHRTSQRGESNARRAASNRRAARPAAATDAPMTASSSRSPTIAGLGQLLEIDVVRHVRLVDDEANELEVARLADVVLRVGLEGGEADARRPGGRGSSATRRSTAPRGRRRPR